MPTRPGSGFKCLLARWYSAFISMREPGWGSSTQRCDAIERGRGGKSITIEVAQRQFRSFAWFSIIWQALALGGLGPHQHHPMTAICGVRSLPACSQGRRYVPRSKGLNCQPLSAFLSCQSDRSAFMHSIVPVCSVCSTVQHRTIWMFAH